MSEIVRYQHRAVTVVPGDNAGEFALQLQLPHAAQRVLAGLGVALDTPTALAADTYRGGYARTHLTGHQDGSPGRYGRAFAGCRMERLTGDQMRAWVAHNAARASMCPRDAFEVDCCVLDEMERGLNMVRLMRGLMALARYYRAYERTKSCGFVDNVNSR